MWWCLPCNGWNWWCLFVDLPFLYLDDVNDDDDVDDNDADDNYFDNGADEYDNGDDCDDGREVADFLYWPS